MKLTNITMGLILFTTILSPYYVMAANYNSSLVAAKSSPAQWLSISDHDDYDNFPEFSIEDFEVQQNASNRIAKIKFTLKSHELLYYHVYLYDIDNFEIMETSGFVNNNTQYVSLKKTSTQPGEYKISIALVDNNKTTVTRNYNITLD
ncbi:hypothetical protein [Yersinia aleksiciae]|uniref:N-acetylglucosamine-binding protein A n=1 Tax=Yersinia aleksiciae TaxID=263819 RepID=A0A0T9UQY9_YERAE|nr:hypothetical protein [Yersinia aleksiciae]CNL62948.1 Uncharacterised protein [Yersinia aleksiciae]